MTDDRLRFTTENKITFPNYKCPTGHVHAGALTLSGFDDDLDGNYCLRCYAEWVRDSIPRAERLSDSAGADRAGAEDE